jgi:hypothetical protein
LRGLGANTVRICVIIVAVVALSGLAGCTSAAERAAAKFASEKTKYEPDVGKEYWVSKGVELCNGPATLASDCNTLPANTHLKIEDVVEGYIKANGAIIYYDDQAYYHVVLDDGRAGFTDALIFRSEVTDIDPAFTAAECTRRGEPRLGMSVKQVEATCWGMPDRVNRRQTAKGIHEQFVYPGNRYVDLHNGIVTSIAIGGIRQRAAAKF